MVFSHVAIRRLKTYFIVLFLILNAACKGTLPMSAPDDNSCLTNERLLQGKQAIDRANALIAQEEYSQAIEILDESLVLLGDSYIYDGLLDDTGQKLLLSNFEKARGAFNVSAALKLGVMNSRLEAYRVAISCK